MPVLVRRSSTSLPQRPRDLTPLDYL
jgi:hypothetical protein